METLHVPAPARAPDTGRRIPVANAAEVMLTRAVLASLASRERRDLRQRPPHDAASGTLTVPRARRARAHHARLAELHAYRHEQALADERHTLAAHCKRDYRKAALRCRLLGEFIRSQNGTTHSRPGELSGGVRR